MAERRPSFFMLIIIFFFMNCVSSENLLTNNNREKGSTSSITNDGGSISSSERFARRAESPVFSLNTADLQWYDRTSETDYDFAENSAPAVARDNFYEDIDGESNSAPEVYSEFNAPASQYSIKHHDDEQQGHETQGHSTPHKDKPSNGLTQASHPETQPHNHNYTVPLWPKFDCYTKYYDFRVQTVHRESNYHCRDETTSQRIHLADQGILDMQGCILYRFKAISVKRKQIMYVTNQGLRQTLDVIFAGLFNRGLQPFQQRERRILIEKLIRKSAPCSAVLNNLANVQKLPSTKWGSFYTCITNAWKCPWGKDTEHPVLKSE